MKNQTIKEKTVVIIPAYEPSASFVDYARELLAKGFKELLVINDGSNATFSPIFDEIRTLENCTVSEYPQNHGKGYALKHAFKIAKEKYSDDVFFITADCDGQHLPHDVERIAEEVALSPNDLVMGSRDFSLPFVPNRSRSGNVFTRRMYHFLYGLSLSDTQTGLRGFSYRLLDELLAIKGDRFEYEMNMLVVLHKNGRVIREIPIETVYNEEMQDGAKVSHYRPFRDSIRILSILFKNLGWYFFSSIVSVVLELIAFYLLTRLVFTTDIQSAALVMFLPTVGARVLSSIFNFTFNFKVVFRGKKKRSIFKYYVLWFIQLGISYGFASGINALFTLSALSASTIALLITLCKGVFDFLIGIASYGVQRAYVFSDPKEE